MDSDQKYTNYDLELCIQQINYYVQRKCFGQITTHAERAMTMKKIFPQMSSAQQ